MNNKHRRGSAAKSILMNAWVGGCQQSRIIPSLKCLQDATLIKSTTPTLVSLRDFLPNTHLNI